MQFSQIFSIAACIVFAHCLPAPAPAPSIKIGVIFKEAAGAEHNSAIPLDGIPRDISEFKEISSISYTDDIAKRCAFKVASPSEFTLVPGPPGTMQVNPSQTFSSITCTEGDTSSLAVRSVTTNPESSAPTFTPITADTNTESSTDFPFVHVSFNGNENSIVVPYHGNTIPIDGNIEDPDNAQKKSVVKRTCVCNDQALYGQQNNCFCDDPVYVDPAFPFHWTED